MHPFILEQLAAAHIRDQLVVAADARRARQARRARSQASGQRTRLSLPGAGAGPARRPAPLAAVRPAADRAGPCVEGSARGTHSNTWTEVSAASAATPNEEIEMAPIYPRAGGHQRQVHPQAAPPLLIRVARALRAVHQELEIASECMLRPGPAPQADPLAWVRTCSGYCLAGRYLPGLPHL